MTHHYLATPLRRALEKAIKEARVVAEAGAYDAIRRLGVAEGKAPTYLSEREKELRRRLRAHARTLGDRLDKDSDEQEVKRLVEAAAYAHWHRMLFARFLAERGLLRHPEHDVPVTLEDCREIAQEEGVADAWAVAERYAASMLPAVFRIDDPVLSMTLDAAQSQSLHRLVTDLDEAVFQAEDSLGWTYQFWRSAEKDAVNRKGHKIGADEISAVTQLFTEPYMVRFLLHNTLGAWWAGKVLAANPELAKSAADEDELRTACSLPAYGFDMLRFVKAGEGDDARWRPAAGIFPGWPQSAAGIRVLDPCCGSGHFLTEILALLSALRATEEGISYAESVRAVLEANLFGLELDGRCVQIAAFAVAMTAWRIGGFQRLPTPHVAWVGSPPPLDRTDFIALANGDTDLRAGLASLHDVFSQAPLLGSLINPAGGDLMSPQRLGRIEPLLERLVEQTRTAEPERSEGAIAARGMADAALLLGGRYTLVATNPPFVTRQAVTGNLRTWLDQHAGEASADLSVAVLHSMIGRLSKGGSVSFVLPTNSFYQPAYKKFRRKLLSENAVKTVARLGAGAFSEVSGEVVKVSLITLSNAPGDGTFWSVDAAEERLVRAKEEVLSKGAMSAHPIATVLADPDARIVIDPLGKGGRLGKLFQSRTGTRTGDNARIIRMFWEPEPSSSDYRRMQTVPDETSLYAGRHLTMLWQNDKGALRELNELGIASIQGMDSWKRAGIAVGLMGNLPSTLYTGEIYDMNTGTLYGASDEDILALFEWIKAGGFAQEVRKIDQQLKLTTATLTKVNFDAEHWRQVAQERYPDGLPKPYSDDPTQWLFHGHPAKADRGTGLHVALARLCGYRWPAETDEEMHLSGAAREWVTRAATLSDGDQDGLLAVSSVAGEKPLADRLRAYLAAVFGADWSDALERRLIAEADEVLDKKQAKDGSLETWLRDRAFRQHFLLFHQRPFIWQIWDGLKDGFSVFVYYHRFSQANLRKLTYTMLGDWLARAKAENNDLRFEKGRELQQMLEKVLEGEAPYDIFVRWKPLAEQSLGWDPDLDDGVRMNIRPFMEAGILREQPKGIKWTKDRGNDVPSAPWYPVFKGERINDHHTTLEEKRAARAGNPRMVAAK